jgi:hypothetical protein
MSETVDSLTVYIATTSGSVRCRSVWQQLWEMLPEKKGL